MPKLANVQRTFLEGVKYGYRLAADETRRDDEGLMNEMRAELNAVRSARARRQATENAADAKRDPETPLN